MANGNSTIGTSKLDKLIAKIERIRQKVREKTGTRQYRLFTVKRTWTGEYAGDGEYTDVEVEILPRPRIHPFVQGGRDLSYTQEPCGLDVAGGIRVTEVSLCYNFEDILGCEAPDAATQYLFRLDEGMGQGQPSRYFVHDNVPFADREVTMGWVLYLRHDETAGC